jgi:phage-related tail protein
MASSLGHLAATVSLNIDPFKSSATALKAQIKSTTSALKAQEQAIKGSGSSLNSMKAAYSTMGSQMKNYEAQLQRQKSTYAELKSQTASTAAEQEKLTARQANAANQVNRTSANMEALRNRMSSLNKSITLQSSGWTQAGNKAVAFGGHMKSVGSSMSNVGSTMTTHVTAPIVAGFGYAISKSINFQNTMNEVKNLLVTGGESAKEAVRGVAEMERDAKTYSDHYGVSQQKIAEGYEELVKRGYSSKQALGAMKYELEASKASGDDFSDVVNVASQTLEAFGMKSNTTAGMTRNTKTAVNELAYAADATSTDFQSLGVGMSYVGSTAHQAGFSLAETSAAMGVLSNNGLWKLAA